MAEKPRCGKQFSFGEQTCVRPAGHLGCHRDHANLRKATKVWGDNECRREARG